MVADNYEQEDLRSVFFDLVLQLQIEQPLKSPFVAAVVLVANTRKPELVDEVLTQVVEKMQEKIERGEWRDVKLHLKFLACLQSVLESDGLFPVLDDLFAQAADLQTASSEDVRAPAKKPCFRHALPFKFHLLTSCRQLAQSSSRSSS